RNRDKKGDFCDPHPIRNARAALASFSSPGTACAVLPLVGPPRTQPRQCGASLRSEPSSLGSIPEDTGRIIPTEWLAGWLGDRMKRREFITLLGGAAAAWPLAARAQQTPRLPAIGFLNPTTASVASQRVAAFVERLRAVGWIEGRAVAIKVRWGEGRSDRAAPHLPPFILHHLHIVVS